MANCNHSTILLSWTPGRRETTEAYRCANCDLEFVPASKLHKLEQDNFAFAQGYLDRDLRIAQLEHRLDKARADLALADKIANLQASWLNAARTLLTKIGAKMNDPLLSQGERITIAGEIAAYLEGK